MLGFNLDAFADSQIASKLWLCEELEKLGFERPPAIAVYGGWYGVFPFLLLSRDRLTLRTIRSLDLDPGATEIAGHINRKWEIEAWKFKAFTRDCNALSPWPVDLGPEPDLIVNTASEHFENMSWWKNIPDGKWVALQSTDQKHDEHFATVKDLVEMRERYPMRGAVFSGEREFVYPDRSFRRFMQIGQK